MKTTDFRELQQTIAELEPREAVLCFSNARILIDNWVVRQEKIYFYYKREYLFSIDNLIECTEYEFYF